MSLNSKITKEYDVKGGDPFTQIFLKHEKSFWKRVKTWFHVRYHIVEMWYYDTKRYLENIARFNKMMKEWYPWDWESQVRLFAYGVEQLSNYIDKCGYEVDESRNKKVAAMRELVALLRTDYEDGLDDKYLIQGKENVLTHVTEYEDGSIGFEVRDEESKKIKENSLKQFEKALKDAREKHYKRIFEIIRGQDIEKLVVKKIGEKRENETLEEYNRRYHEAYDELFDGTGIEGWWD